MVGALWLLAGDPFLLAEVRKEELRRGPRPWTPRVARRPHRRLGTGAIPVLRPRLGSAG